MRLEHLSLAEWADALPEKGIGVFHTPEALSVLDDYTESDLVLIGGFKGDRPVALLPLFVRSLPIGKLVTSPPPGKNVPRLGPVMMPASPKKRKRERLNRKFTEAVVEEFGLDDPLTLFQMTCRPEFGDPRPYAWTDMNVDTSFTYWLDLAETTPEDLLADASKSLRREVSDGNELDVVVNREGIGSAFRVFKATRDRYEEQGISFPMRWPYVRDLFRALGDRARVYVVRSTAGEFLTGITALYSPSEAYFWQGGGQTVYDGVAVNSLLHWRILEDIRADPPADTVHRYDLYGANTPRLCQYKSKFGGELVPYYRVTTGGLRMAIAEWAYEFVA
ncbi:GNAT family N-acetyltransferase [Halorubrum sp. AD140]|uniref:GNAT family N-acetyltransferase n=1 Tax=Halorubrum sp. AD140 TaxID=3050073 RepID=UPI002ACC7220|nr:GNAT family N-acetyltransferase [Halorubrum sp. AD140]MDZ5810210.1 GNAT family N-acetyltransferase [Halorubrum sp. AD140]